MSTYVANINERIAQGAADSWDQAARAVFVFLRREHFRVFLGDDFVVVERRAGYINWAGCGPSSPCQISSPDTTFFKMKKASPSIRLFEEYPGKVNLLFSAPLGCKLFPRGDALGLTGKWALKNNKWDVIIKTGQ